MGFYTLRLQRMVKRLARKECLSRNTRLLDTIPSNLITGIGEEQRGNNLIHQRLIVAPLIDPALTNVQAGMDAGDVRGRRGGKLRRQLGNHAFGQNRPQKAIFFRIALKKTPAKGIDEEKNDLPIPRRQRSQYVQRHGVVPLSRQQELNGSRQPRETIRIVAWLDKTLGELRAIDHSK